LQCKKKLAHFLFDFGIVNTTDNDCKQQIPSVATDDNTGREMTVCSVHNTKVEQEAVLIFAHVVYLNISPGGGSESSNKINDANFLTVFHSNDGSGCLQIWQNEIP